MLDFLLVLGQIPGTDFQLTFSEILLASLVLLAFAYWRAAKMASGAAGKSAVWFNSVPSYEQLTLNIPAEPGEEKLNPAVTPTLRKDVAHRADTWLLWLDRHWRIIH